ncbi:MAG: pirin family protein [Anaerolineales bacterium]|nr:pirin family protein [Anaerolineales bacterium]
MTDSIRRIMNSIEPQVAIEGAGVKLLRSFGPSRENPYDPFLLFDHFAFNDPIEGPIVGFPTHPHRGIETVTYMLAGNTRHRDSLGNLGVIGPGDVQWMTSGSGIMHEEMPKRGPDGKVRGFQLWVNLPKAQKMSSPRYQDIRQDQIPIVELDGVRVRVVAGTYRGTDGPVTEIAARPLYMDVSIEPGIEFNLPVPVGHTAIGYLFEGAARFGDTSEPVSANRMLVFGDGDRLVARTDDAQGARFVLMAGKPFDEVIYPYGPFVMNTEQEIRQAIHELRNGTFVKEGASWKEEKAPKPSP